MMLLYLIWHNLFSENDKLWFNKWMVRVMNFSDNVRFERLSVIVNYQSSQNKCINKYSKRRRNVTLLGTNVCQTLLEADVSSGVHENVDTRLRQYWTYSRHLEIIQKLTYIWQKKFKKDSFIINADKSIIAVLYYTICTQSLLYCIKNCQCIINFYVWCVKFN